jgi:hypothetical protein
MSQDYTTYIKVDPNGRFVVTSTLITVTGLRRDEDAYIYKDFGVNFFNGDFTHELKAQCDSAGTNLGILPIWAVTNDIDDVKGLADNSKSFYYSYVQEVSPNAQYVLVEVNAGSFTLDTSNLSLDTTYYTTINRDYVGGLLTMLIYSDSGRTVLVDTLSVSLPVQLDLRYAFAVSSFNSGTDQSVNGLVGDLDLGLDIHSLTVGVATAVDGGNHDIDVSMPYTDDENTDSTYTVDYKLSSDALYTNWVTGASNTPSPFLTTITGLQGAETYDVRVTYVDPDGVTGTNPQTITGISIEALPNKIIPIVVKNGVAYKIIRNDSIGKIIKRITLDKVVK